MANIRLIKQLYVHFSFTKYRGMIIDILEIMSKSYWLMKSEPNVWSIDQQKEAGVKGAPGMV